MKRFACLVGSAGLVLTLGGCIERKETIAVSPDGSAVWSLEWSGDETDFGPGDAVPSAAAGWNVKMDADPDEEDSVKLVGRRSIAAGDAWPTTFAVDDAEADTALQFTTSVRTESTPQGTLMHFERRYTGRAEARFANHLRRLQESGQLPDDDGDALDFEQLDPAEQETRIRALMRVELLKHAEIVEAAIEQWGGATSPLVELRLRSSLLDLESCTPLAGVLELLHQDQTDERDARIAALAAEFEGAMRSTIAEAVAALPLSDSDRADLLASIETERTRRSVTEDLADERWQISLELPGEVIAHNGDRAEHGAVQWEFAAADLHDQDVVLLATSLLSGAGTGD